MLQSCSLCLASASLSAPASSALAQILLFQLPLLELIFQFLVPLSVAKPLLTRLLQLLLQLVV